jgi:type VI protein secretion system component Hcp
MHASSGEWGRANDSASGGAADEYLKYELKNVRITSVQAGRAGARADAPTETLSLNYDKIKTTTVKRPATPPEQLRGTGPKRDD